MRPLVAVLVLAIACSTPTSAPPAVAPTVTERAAPAAPALPPAPSARPERPFVVDDVIEQHRHFDVTTFLPGPKEDKVGTRWKVLFIDEDCVGIRLVEGRYQWVGDEPDKLPGYESKFCASDNYKRAFPDRPGKQQAFDEFRVVGP